MIVIDLLGVVLLFGFAFLLPGGLLSRLLIPDATPSERFTISGVCGFSLVPLLLYLATTFTNRPLTPGVMLVGSLALSAGLFAVLKFNGRVDPIDPRAAGVGAAVAAGFTLLLAASVQPIGGVDLFATIHHCMYVMVMYAIGNDPSVGVPMYDGISGQVIHLLSHHPHDPVNGLQGLFGEQRPGNVAILAPHVTLFGTLGWLTAPVYASVVGAAACYCAARELGASPAASAVGVGLGMLGLHSFLGYVINENLFGFTLMAVLFWIGVKKQLRAEWLVLAGLVAAHGIGVRYTTCLFWPALAWRFARCSEVGRPALRAAFWGVPAGLVSIPWLALNVAMLDRVFAHPAVALNLDDTVVTNRLFGMSFQFKALNWPFAEEVVRAPWNAFPTSIWLGLQAVQDFGAIVCALGIAGLVGLWLRDRSAALFALAFGLPHLLAIDLLENLNRAQITYVLLGAAPLLVCAALALGGLFEGEVRRARITSAAALGVVLLSTWTMRLVDVPADRRQAGEAGEVPVQESLRRALTTPRLLPMVAPIKGARLAHAAASVSNQHNRSAKRRSRSGGVALMVPFGREEATDWSFPVVGRPLREAGDPFRTSQGLHTIALALPAEWVTVDIQAIDGNYEVRLTDMGRGTVVVHDFTLIIHGWARSTESVDVFWNGEPLPVRFEQTVEDHEWRTGITTNYPAPVVGFVEVPYTVDLNTYESECGYFTFVGDGGGGHRHAWDGARTGVLRVPRGFVADRAIFLPNPWCRSGPPQPGAPYAEAVGPFDPSTPLQFTIDRTFPARGGGWLEFHDPPRGP